MFSYKSAVNNSDWQPRPAIQQRGKKIYLWTTKNTNLDNKSFIFGQPKTYFWTTKNINLDNQNYIFGQPNAKRF